MTTRIIYQCNVCKEERKETNHWFVAMVSMLGLRFIVWERAESEGLLKENNAKHICGQRCAHALLDEFMSSPSVTFPPENDNVAA